MELLPHPEGCCDTVGSLELRFFSSFYLRSTDEVIDETSFEVFTVLSLLKVEISLSLSFPLLRHHE